MLTDMKLYGSHNRSGLSQPIIMGMTKYITGITGACFAIHVFKCVYDVDKRLEC